MPVQPYVNRLEPSDDGVIWRFLDMPRFRDLMASEELYFRRSDLFDDESEGLPPDDYALPVLGLNPYDVKDQQALNNHIGFIAQNRESYYISCWHLFCRETLKMWEQYAKEGLAICSRYELLKYALDTQLDTAHLGLVQYGIKHLSGFNTLQFITTKQPKYADEREVRAFLSIIDPLETGNRHFDENNRAHRSPLPINPRHAWIPDCKRRRIDLRALLTGIVMSPWASEAAVEEVKLWVKIKGHSYAVQPSGLAAHSGLIPSPDEFKKYCTI